MFLPDLELQRIKPLDSSTHRLIEVSRGRKGKKGEENMEAIIIIHPTHPLSTKKTSEIPSWVY